MASETTETTVQRSLFNDAIDAKPIDYTWTGRNVEYDDTDEERGGWRIVLPHFDTMDAGDLAAFFSEHGYLVEADEALTLARADDGEDVDASDIDLDKLRERAGEVCDSDELYVPMMNYAYPLPNFQGDAGDAQFTLDTLGHGCACVVVEIGGEPWLALAGGGMDLSWDICRAYIALGYYPPAHYAGRLPRQGETDVETARIALEACRIAARWATSRVEDAVRILEHTADLAEQRSA